MTKNAGRRRAGSRLRAGLDKALARAANDRRLPALEFTEVEQGLVNTAVEMVTGPSAKRRCATPSLPG